MRSTTFKHLANWLVVVGGLNWGLTLFNFNVVTWLAGIVNWSTLATVLYALIGVSALVKASELVK